jgi:hypothetical protein
MYHSTSSDHFTKANLQINPGPVLQRHQAFALVLRTAAYHRDAVTFLCMIPEKGSCETLAAFVATKTVTSLSEWTVTVPRFELQIRRSELKSFSQAVSSA